MRVFLFCLLSVLSLWLFANVVHLAGGNGMTVPLTGYGVSKDDARASEKTPDKTEGQTQTATPLRPPASGDVGSSASLTLVMPQTVAALSVLFALCGALGATLHALGSLVAFIGNEKFKNSWAAWYLAQPLRGATLAAGFFWLLQGGLLGGIGVGQAPVNGIAMMGATFLVGLFSDPAIEKLRELFQVLFRTEEKPRKDPLSSVRKPTIADLKLDVSTAAAPLLKIAGSNFDATDEVWVNSKLLPTSARTDKSIELTLTQVPVTGSILRAIVIPVHSNADPSNAKEMKVP